MAAVMLPRTQGLPVVWWGAGVYDPAGQPLPELATTADFGPHLTPNLDSFQA